VEFGGGESKDLRLHFGTYAKNFGFTTLAAKRIGIRAKKSACRDRRPASLEISG
jgi:hypothetical protein